MLSKSKLEENFFNLGKKSKQWKSKQNIVISAEDFDSLLQNSFCSLDTLLALDRFILMTWFFFSR